MNNRDLRNRTPSSLLDWLVRSLIVVLLLSGVGLLGSGIWIKAKAALSQVLLHRSFEQSIIAGTPVKPWSWADITPMARLTAERIGRSQIVLSGTSGQALAFGPGHLSNTPLPGSQGTSVLAAHRDTHFNWIRHLVPGDRLQLKSLDGTVQNYSVRRAWVAPYNQSGIFLDSDEHLLALTTCYPFDAKVVGDDRYIVEASLISD